METLSAHNVDPTELAQLDTVVANLPEDSQLGAALQYVSSSVRRGVGVTLAEADEQLTPAMAAKVLGMSRTHLYKLMDAGVIPAVNVGRDRRLAFSDVVTFATEQHGERAALAERFAHARAARSALLNRLGGEPTDA